MPCTKERIKCAQKYVQRHSRVSKQIQVYPDGFVYKGRMYSWLLPLKWGKSRYPDKQIKKVVAVATEMYVATTGELPPGC